MFEHIPDASAVQFVAPNSAWITFGQGERPKFIKFSRFCSKVDFFREGLHITYLWRCESDFSKIFDFVSPITLAQVPVFDRIRLVGKFRHRSLQRYRSHKKNIH